MIEVGVTSGFITNGKENLRGRALTPTLRPSMNSAGIKVPGRPLKCNNREYTEKGGSKITQQPISNIQLRARSARVHIGFRCQ